MSEPTEEFPFQISPIEEPQVRDSDETPTESKVRRKRVPFKLISNAEDVITPAFPSKKDIALDLFVAGTKKALEQYAKAHRELTYPGFKELDEALKLLQS